MKSTVDYYFRAYAPTCVTQKVDTLILKKKEMNDAVKDKINEVFTTCERIIDHYIPDATYERPEVDEDASVFSRMNVLSHEITTRVCDRFLPFLTEKNETMKTQLKQKQEEMKPLVESLNKVKDQCVETVKPVVEPFAPITTPLACARLSVHRREFYVASPHYVVGGMPLEVFRRLQKANPVVEE